LILKIQTKKSLFSIIKNVEEKQKWEH